MDFKVKYRRKLFASNYSTVFELASNNIDTTNVARFDRKETITIKGVFIDENYKYDNSFWGRYNYIIPDDSLEEALIRIKRQIEEIKND